MILFLDPLGDHDLPDNITEAKYVKLFSDELIKLNNSLLKVPEILIDTIDEIMIQIDVAEQYKYVEKNLKKLQSILVKQAKKIPKLEQLYKDIKIVDNSDKYERYDKMEGIYLNSIIFFDFTLTNSLCLSLIASKEIYGYRFIIEDDKEKLEEIQDSNKYLLIAVALFYNYIGVDNVKQIVLNSRQNANSDSIDSAKKEFETNKKSTHRFIFTDPNKKNYKDFIHLLQFSFGQSFVVTCDNDEYFLPRNKESLLITHIERLSTNKRSELLHEIITGEYSKRLVVLVDTNVMDLEGYPQISEWFIMPEDERTNQLDSALYRSIPVVEFINKEADKFQYFCNLTISNEKQLQHQLAIVEQLRMSGRFLLPGIIDFWYDMGGIEVEDLETWVNKFEEQVKKYIIGDDLVGKIFYKISHEKNKNVWIIEKNGTVIKDIPYSRSKGIKYIAYLAKYYQTRTISDSDLRGVVDKWHGKSSKKAEVSTDAKKILQDLIYLFEKQCPELAPINDCIVISSKEPGCHFRTVENISLEISDEDIPDPIY